MLLLDLATAAASAANAEIVAATLPQVVGSNVARARLAVEWLLGSYVPAWLCEAGLSPVLELDTADRAANDAWIAMRDQVKAACPADLWTAMREDVRDAVRDTMQASAEATIRLPIETLEWSRIERKIWSTVEACLWTIAWRSLLTETGQGVRPRVIAALEPMKVASYRSVVTLIERMSSTAPAKPARVPFEEDAVLYGADEQVLAFMREHLPQCGDFGTCTALGLVRHGKIVGGIVWNNYQPGVDIEISAAVTTKLWARPRTVQRIFHYPFVHLGLPRITSHVPKKLKAVRKLNEGLGFRIEGVKRRGVDGRQDLICYGMLREECRYLKGS